MEKLMKFDYILFLFRNFWENKINVGGFFVFIEGIKIKLYNLIIMKGFFVFGRKFKLNLIYM